ncbi:MAG: DUF1611 domain-containing protein [Lewinellaceae bacterium]|nr:DUF1611 domain-containing protein [Lewinellaceae bacterium]MCB9291323.1 DUF1611 domain-containing protein [Lewinellaceae bacterium]
MQYQFTFTSLARNSGLMGSSFEARPIPFSQWANGDFIAVELMQPGSEAARIELFNGRMMDPLKGERLIGALGVRHATLEITGSWKAINPGERFQLMTAAGLLGKVTSKSTFSPIPIQVEYLGHVIRHGAKCTMARSVRPIPQKTFTKPIILMVGTSMSAGKTTTARIVTRELKSMGLKVIGAKVTGAGRYRDILAVKDAGAAAVFDFVDAGLPSTVCPKEEFLPALEHMLSLMAAEEPDVAVVEIGASPMEPYNGDVAIDYIRENICCTMLCASDPYAVYGVMKSFGLKPDLVSGPATNTIAAVELVEKLCRMRALNLLNPGTRPALRKLLRDRLCI